MFIVYQVVAAFRKESAGSGFITRIGLLFFISCLANLGWILAWHYGLIALSLVIMLILIVSLLSVYLRLDIGRSTCPAAVRYMVHMPFSVYLGWITIATIVNVTVVLIHAGWNRFGFSELLWTIVMMIAGTLITLLMIFTRKDIFYALVVAWAFLGIWIRQTNHEVTSTASAYAGTVALILTGIILLSMVIQMIRKKVY
jgi:hypothetical protein